MKSKYLELFVFLAIAGFLGGCSASRLASDNGLLGGLIGASAGVAGGALAAEADSSIDADKAMQAFALYGSVAGASSGAYVDELQGRAQRKVFYRRVPIGPPREQQRIDEIRSIIDADTDFGANEIRPYHERYQTSPSNTPYLGPN